MKKSFGLAILLACGATSGASPALAQSFDRNALEDMFGEPVTTSATGQPQRAREVPADMEIVTAEQIRRTGADTLPDVLRFVAGIDVRQYGLQDASVGIRGYDTALNPRVLVLLDGRQVYQDDYGLTVWSLIPVALSSIRQIEIIKGPSAALYGFNAVSGVINIVTYDPLTDKVNGGRVMGGTQNQTYGEAVATAQVPGVAGVRLSAEGFRSTEFTGYGQGDTREQPHSGTAAVDGRFLLGHGIEWDLFGSIGSVDSNYYIDTGTYTPIAFKANSLRSALSADTPIGVLKLDYYRNENRTSEDRAAEQGSGENDHWREDLNVVQASDLFKLGTNNTFRIAGEYRDNSVASLQTFSGRLGYTIVAGSLMWAWQILPQLSLTNVIRVDDLSLSHDGGQFYIPTLGPLYLDARIIEPNFNSGLVYKPTPYDTVRVTAARATQIPVLVDFGFARTYGDAIVAGNTGLRPSEVQNYEVDYDRKLAVLDSTLRLAAFAQRMDATIGSPFGSGETLLPTYQALLRATNFSGSNEAGGEIGITGSSPNGLRWNLSYALAAVRDSTPEDVLSQAATVSFQRQTPTNSVIAGAGYTWRRLDLDVQARWQSHIEDFALDTSTGATAVIVVPDYVTVNLHAAYRINRLFTASVLAEQVNKQQIAETAGLAVDRQFLAGLELRF
ncbi:TonB-dependent receptor plug domain-containing protein [Lichenicoccus roseus]|uniref:Uncharacterized protein n=1 Tax=Lichenicoccus roseus TaxID=2683649 RepID=A0A5R9J4Z6_9PROT|nr:TonB-dependent receptor [Lichenicoccus roseus]TLU72632.1 hypothetical protein FE263_11365 [Lichenicoccus roseus]